VLDSRRPAFGLEWVETFLGHYKTADWSELHREVADDLSDFHAVRGQRRAYLAPRGGAKTTWLSKAYPLWCAVEGVEPLTLLLAETDEQAEAYLAAIKRELETNRDLARVYGSACGVGPVWRTDKVTLRNGSTIVARGAGGRILGLTEGAARPTLVVGDDMNQRADAYSPTLRRRKLDWFLKDVLNVGEPRTNFLAAGTPIHRGAVVCELKQNVGWTTRSYQSVLSWPNRMDLWAEWERLLMNWADEDRLTTARAFYEARRAEMVAGSRVLWESREPIYDLMALRATIGPSAFDSEKQDRPGTDGATEWPEDYFEHTADHPFWFDRWPSELVWNLQSLDPSKGANEEADYQAHVRLGLDRKGVLHVEADLRREPATAMVGRALDLYALWNPSELWAEANNTMGLLMPEFQRQVANRRQEGLRPALCNYREIDHNRPKLERMRRVGGYLARNQVRVRNTPGGRLLVDQWKDVPNGEYDDGPDAVGTLINRLEELANGRK
jgi:hypothetical protein